MCMECDFAHYIELADEMLDDNLYEFAWDTVEGIRKWTEEHNHITERQIVALENVYESVCDRNKEKDGEDFMEEDNI